ncbi:hypothetical protein [Paenibacillus tengchongensis]|uniref:hypothetical protein n=1 Tax=Paenibacillus tengchongensis TaxID=2608684 RepID=UPI00124DEF21|nr:hypothetical protein [Paenibacillus tengchongensis]
MWTTVRGEAGGYNDEVKAVDEQILQLVLQRRQLTAGRHLFPKPEIIEEWAGHYGIEAEQITHTFGGIVAALPRRRIREDNGPLQGVLPIMKISVQSDVEYAITHAMQYSEFSIVSVQITYLKASEKEVNLSPALTLAVEGSSEYEVQHYGGHGGGPKTQIQFAVSPPLPPDLEDVRLRLVPGGLTFMMPRYTEIQLNEQVDFD